MENIKGRNSLVAIFDSGVGGLSVWKELIKVLPCNHFLYLSDSAYCPYGSRPQKEIIARAKKITGFFLSKGVSLIVVACNTATAAAIDTLRKDYDIPFIGMEPALKPAALHSKSGVIGVLATQGTFKGKQYNKTLERFASEVLVIERVGTGLVELVEAGKIKEEKTRKLLKSYILPMMERGADYIVLGCTHYPFLLEEIQNITGNNIKIVDPAPAVALHTFNTLSQSGLISDVTADPYTQTLFYSTGPIDNLVNMARSILPGIPIEQFIRNSI